MSRVLLLNPPGSQNYIRDYFCSKLAKSNYISPPVALIMLSGLLAGGHDVAVQDAIVERLAPEESLRRIARFAPDAVVSLVGAASWDEDRAFLDRLRQAAPQALLVGLGDVLLEDTDSRLAEAPALDAALFSFIAPGLLDLLAGPQGRPLANIRYRDPSGKWIGNGLEPVPAHYRVPRPRHEWFPLRRYRFPFAVGHPLTAMLTDYGCPFRCDFCVIPGLGFGVRPLPDLEEELKGLHQQGVREIFFLDQTFGVRRDRTLALCEMLGRRPFRFHWSCFSRADVLDAELLAAMARAGCHTIIFGVESGSEQTLQQYHKNIPLGRIRETLAACRASGIRAAATFMLGLPGETEAQARETIRLALELPLDYVAFNVAIPRANTGLRAQAISQGLIQPSVRTMDQSGLQGAMATRELPAERILALRREAVRRFYLRPGYLARRLFTLRSWWDFRSQLADGVGVVADALNLGKKAG
ncbi:MAG: B12-binding domain-containing radical SAM protein [candidate division FCPU426 bacterium]